MLAALSRLNGYKTLQLDEKGRLLDVLCSLESMGGGFFADKDMKVPLSDEQIVSIVGYDFLDWIALKIHLIQGKILKEHNGGVYCPLLTERVDIKSDPAHRELAEQVLSFWNSQNIQKHSITTSLTDKVVRLIKKYNYTRAQMEDAITNYATVLGSEKYFWTKKWSLVDFLSRGVDRFVSDAKPFEQFQQIKKAGGGGRSIMAPRQAEEYDFEGIR